MRDLQKYYEKALEQVLDSAIIPGDIVEVTTMNGCQTLGRCKRNFNGTYTIYINECWLYEDVDEEGLMNTLVHEILHSCYGCMNHGRQWKDYAMIMNFNYGYHISRTTDSAKYGANKHFKYKSDYKYKIVCKTCKKEYFYKRRGDIVKTIEHNSHGCECPKCKGRDFKLITL